MARTLCHALLIDSNPATSEQLRRLLANASSVFEGVAFQLDAVTTVEQGHEQLKTQVYDVLLLEISLFDPFSKQQERQSFSTMASTSAPKMDISLLAHLPIIVISARDEEVLAIRAIESGAYGYLLTPHLTINSLQYALRFAMRKHQQLLSMFSNSQQDAQEMAGWEQLTQQRGAPSLTARLFDAGSLRETVPDAFAQLVAEYGLALDRALEQRAYRIDSPQDNAISALAEQLGFLKAGPRDVIEMHTQALKGKTQNTLPEKARAYLIESRLTVLEVMGDLVSYYRRYFVSLGRVRSYRSEDSS